MNNFGHSLKKEVDTHTHCCIFLSETLKHKVVQSWLWYAGSTKRESLKKLHHRFNFLLFGFRIRRVFLDVLRNLVQRKQHGIVEFPSLASKEANQGQRARKQLGEPSWLHGGMSWAALEMPWQMSVQFTMSTCEAASAWIWNTLACALGAVVPAVWGTQKGARARGTSWKRFLPRLLP